jgi:hypothetical protein
MMRLQHKWIFRRETMTVDRTIYASAGAVFAFTLLLSGAAHADKLSFNYVEANYQVVDVDIDETVSDGSDTLSLQSDDDDGFDIAAAWEFYGHFHVFAAYSKASNDFEGIATIGDQTVTASGDFDVVRARGGVGYGWPLNEQWTMYSRLTWDYIELDDISVGDLEAEDQDDDGFGFEAGLRWLPVSNLELQAYGRYSDVGKLDAENGFDDDVLGGIQGRWYITEQFAIQAGYEYGDITSYGGGLRFAF